MDILKWMTDLFHHCIFTSQQQSCSKVTFSVVHVCHSVHGGGGSIDAIGQSQIVWGPLTLALSSCTHHTGPLWPSSSPSLSSSPRHIQNLFNLDLTIQGPLFEHVQTCSLCSLYCLQAGIWHSTVMPSCYFVQFFLLPKLI